MREFFEGFFGFVFTASALVVLFYVALTASFLLPS